MMIFFSFFFFRYISEMPDENTQFPETCCGGLTLVDLPSHALYLLSRMGAENTMKKLTGQDKDEEIWRTEGSGEVLLQPSSP